MTAAQLRGEIVDRLDDMPKSMLVELLRRLNVDNRDEADTVLNLGLDSLMKRIPEAEFVAFCDELEKAHEEFCRRAA